MVAVTEQGSSWQQLALALIGRWQEVEAPADFPLELSERKRAQLANKSQELRRRFLATARRRLGTFTWDRLHASWIASS
jgi:hypothetical protein